MSDAPLNDTLRFLLDAYGEKCATLADAVDAVTQRNAVENFVTSLVRDAEARAFKAERERDALREGLEAQTRNFLAATEATRSALKERDEARAAWKATRRVTGSA